jgi:hypothetical protein
MTEIFTPEQITALGAEIDAQLRELNTTYPSAATKGIKLFRELPDKQRQAIEQTVQQDVPSFMERFLQVAKKDLCEEGGVLHEQWKKWRDISNQQILQSFGGILVAMGCPATAISVLAVALAVIVLHLGAETICRDAANADSSSKETDSSVQ